MRERDYRIWLKTLFYITLIALLVPIWQNKFFLTNDGPCHLYNASVLKDFVFGNHTSYYSTYYWVNPELEPNWFTHVVYALLQCIFSPFLTEKILLTAYLFGFVFALKSLLNTIGNGRADWLIILGMPLLYQKVFLMGFFNCAFSYVFFLLLLNYWLKRRGQLNVKSGVVLMLLLLLTFFTHPMGFLLSLASIGLIFLIDTIKAVKKRNDLIQQGIQGLILFVAGLPPILLMLAYLARSNQQSLELNITN